MATPGKKYRIGDLKDIAMSFLKSPKVFALFRNSIYGYFISNFINRPLKENFYTPICIIFYIKNILFILYAIYMIFFTKKGLQLGGSKIKGG